MRKREQINEILSNDLKFELFYSIEDQIEEDFVEWLTGGSSVEIDVNLIKNEIIVNIENLFNK